MNDEDDESFTRHRSLLFTVAYEMLGSAADADDVVQETWLRWADVDPAEVRDQRAYLVRIVTRVALNRLRTLTRQREDYVGQWLPEPLVTTADVADDTELAENVSIALLTVLETLGPVERAVFVLHDVFDTPHREIAEVVGKTPAAVRQIARRARAHVAARRPRMDVDRDQQQAVVEKFLAAASTGDVAGLMAVLAPDVVAVGDGGGLAAAARNPVTGAEKVAAVLTHGATKVSNLVTSTTWVNGMPGARVDIDGAPTALSMVVEDGRITRIYAIRNPQKLGWLDKVATIRR